MKYICLGNRAFEFPKIRSSFNNDKELDMLVLTRRREEGIILGDDIRLAVIGIDKLKRLVRVLIKHANFIYTINLSVGITFKLMEDVFITILHVNSNQTKLGVDAPLEMSIHREEFIKAVVTKLQQENPGKSIEELQPKLRNKKGEIIKIPKCLFESDDDFNVTVAERIHERALAKSALAKPKIEASNDESEEDE